MTVPGEAAVGRCEIEVAAGGRTIRRDWDLVAKPTRRPQPFGPDDVFYLVMPDRFANGDPANDESAGGDRMLDRRDTHAYHGGDFAGLRKRLPDLADLGVTAVWLTPVYRAAPPGSRRTSQEHSGKWPTFMAIALSTSMTPIPSSVRCPIIALW